MSKRSCHNNIAAIFKRILKKANFLKNVLLLLRNYDRLFSILGGGGGVP